MGLGRRLIHGSKCEPSDSRREQVAVKIIYWLPPVVVKGKCQGELSSTDPPVLSGGRSSPSTEGLRVAGLGSQDRG